MPPTSKATYFSYTRTTATNVVSHSWVLTHLQCAAETPEGGAHVAAGLPADDAAVIRFVDPHQQVLLSVMPAGGRTILG